MSFISVFNTLGGSKKYVSGQIVFEKNIAGTYQLNILQPGTFYVEMVGGGGGGANGTGGTGAVYLGNIFLYTGIITIQVGSGGLHGNRNTPAYAGTATYIANIINCEQGYGGPANRKGFMDIANENRGGNFQVLDSKLVLQPENGKNGKKGTGAAAHNTPKNYSDFTPNTNYGSGGHGNSSSNRYDGGYGGTGFMRITYLSKQIIKD